MQNLYITGICAAVAIAIVCVVSYAAIKLAQSAPKALVRALLALALALGAIPPILYALYGA
ncbi:hypothetical protein GCM10010149_06450 [Nonomuraea roseoviolacea subsp. roseoviolacea]|uniref:ABC-type phosphate transport system permease subunit n=1 Tax=Nonomuraea roseoviolacea subsp. carminata TaxID=160689 RepID=A0ABT1K5N7_9ACTN|nr:ABC-type phosphate transport system permease subunit [Nonomuraea roseoviolacea subsp. carminata]